MKSGEYLDLFVHMAWADALMWQSVLALPSDKQERPLLDRLYHLHVVQRVYLQLWRGEPRDVPESAAFADLPSLAKWVQPYHPEVVTFVRSMPDEAVGRELTLPWVDHIVKLLGRADPATLGETLLQVVTHSAYHRGQVATDVRALGGEPAQTDYIRWIWLGRPAAAAIVSR